MFSYRKFLSRYSSGKSEENINPKNLLKNYLINGELWPISFDDNEIDNEINSIFGNFEITISQAVNLYDYLGGDIQKLVEIKEKCLNYSEKVLNSKKNLDEEKINSIEQRNSILDNNLKEIIKNEIRKSIYPKKIKDVLPDNTDNENEKKEEKENISEENNEEEEDEVEEEEEDEEKEEVQKDEEIIY